MGISFSGGLSIVAAGRPSLANRVAYVFSLGGHDDLPRVLRYLCTGHEPRPTRDVQLGRRRTDNDFVLPPHDYGVAVILLSLADRVVPAAQADRLRDGVRQYLWASALDGGVDKARAPAEFEAVQKLARTLPEPSATLLRYVNDRDVVHLGPRLLPYVNLYGGDAALSVSKSPKPSAPAFLLHGTEDNVIPSVESEYMADDLRGHAPTRLLLSGLISHAEADRPMHAGDVLQLAGFWGDLLAKTRAHESLTDRDVSCFVARASRGTSPEDPFAGWHCLPPRVRADDARWTGDGERRDGPRTRYQGRPVPRRYPRRRPAGQVARAAPLRAAQ